MNNKIIIYILFYIHHIDFTGKDVVLLNLSRQISSIFQPFETFGFGLRPKAEAFLHIRLWPKAKNYLRWPLLGPQEQYLQSKILPTTLKSVCKTFKMKRPHLIGIYDVLQIRNLKQLSCNILLLSMMASFGDCLNLFRFFLVSVTNLLQKIHLKLKFFQFMS